MSRKEIDYRDGFRAAIDSLGEGGLLLVVGDGQGRPNAMTIGWGTIGIIWGRPVFVVLVRPSRYTYGLLEGVDDFTVNVLPSHMAEALAFCGKASGRDHDKFAEMGLVATPGRKVKSPSIDQAVLHYECKVVHKNDVDKDALVQGILDSAYPQGDYHRVYFGEILGTYAVPGQ